MLTAKLPCRELDNVVAGHPKAVEELDTLRKWANDAAWALGVFMALGADAPHKEWHENAVLTARLLNAKEASRI